MLSLYATPQGTHGMHDRTAWHIFRVKRLVTFIFRSWKNMCILGVYKYPSKFFLLPSVDQKIIQLNLYSAMCEHKRGWGDLSGHTNYNNIISLLMQNHALEVCLIEEISIEEFKVHLTSKCFIAFIRFSQVFDYLWLVKDLWCQVFFLV